MKNLKTTLSILAIFIFSTSCDQEGQIAPSQPEFVEIEIPDVFKSSTGSSTSYTDVDDLVLDVQMTATDGKEVTGKVHLVMPDDGTISYLAVTRNIFDTAKLTPGFWQQALDRAPSNGRVYGTQGCFASCRVMKKRQGRGTCKALCWLQIIKDVASVFASIVTISKG